jgi:OmpA-OmpF porin, OOP family
MTTRIPRLLFWMVAVALAAGCAKQLPREAPLAVSPARFSDRELREVSNVIVVTDASGTMYMDETFPQAQALSASFVKALPDASERARSSAYNVAAIGFGGDERVTAPLAPFDRQHLISTVEEMHVMGTKLGTGGTTPIHAVISEIGAELDGKSGDTAIVLFSDGRADDPALALANARALAESYRGGRVCFHGVQIGDDPVGAGFLRSLSQVTPCGSFETAAQVGNASAFSSFAKAVVVGEGALPSVAAGPPSRGECAGKIRLRGIEFGFDKANIDPAGAAVLEVAIDTLKTCPSLTVHIDGHTDSIGTEAYNKGLSERRAKAVKAYLTSHGIPASRLTAAGHGFSEPIASNDTREGRARNRRVELAPR